MELLAEPWLAHARLCMRGRMDHLPDAEDLALYLWIEWDLSDFLDLDKAWTLTLETVELLDLLARVDYKGTWTLVLGALDMKIHVDLLDELPGPIYPRHSFEWSTLQVGSEPPERTATRVERLIVAKRSDSHTEGFHEARAALLARCRQATPLFPRTAENRIGFTLRVKLIASNPESTDLALADLDALERLAALARHPSRLELLRELQLVEDDPTAEHSPFRWDRVAITLSVVTASDEMLQKIERIASCGIRVGWLTMGWSRFMPNRLTPCRTAKFLRSEVFAGSPTPMALSIGQNMALPVFEAFCSAMMECQTVNDITFSTARPTVEYWAWLALAIFSCEAINSVQYIHINVQHLQQIHVDALKQVIDAENPLAALDRLRAIIARSLSVSTFNN